jgi:hypothetical protein
MGIARQPDSYYATSQALTNSLGPIEVDYVIN